MATFVGIEKNCYGENVAKYRRNIKDWSEPEIRDPWHMIADMDTVETRIKNLRDQGFDFSEDTKALEALKLANALDIQADTEDFDAASK